MEYMSKEGYESLVAELKHMETVELPQVRDAIAEARAQGDLSENFEYHAAKREQARLHTLATFYAIIMQVAVSLTTAFIRCELHRAYACTTLTLHLTCIVHVYRLVPCRQRTLTRSHQR